MKDQKKRAALLAESLSRQHSDIRVKNFLYFMDLIDFVSGYMENEMRRVGLTETQGKILHFLLTQPRSMTPTELSTYTRRTRDTATKAVNSLEKMGLVSSIRSRADRRLRRVRLTEKGLDLMEEILPFRNRVFKEPMDCFNREENEGLNILLTRFGNHLNRLTAPPGGSGEDCEEYKPAMLHLLAGKRPVNRRKRS